MVGLLASKYNFYPLLEVGTLAGENEVIVVFIFGIALTRQSILGLCKNTGCTAYERKSLPENCQVLPTFNHSFFLQCVTNDREKKSFLRSIKGQYATKKIQGKMYSVLSFLS